MLKKYPRVWEEINDDKEAGCARLKIYGGWLISAWANKGKEPSESLVYVPDKNHEWILE